MGGGLLECTVVCLPKLEVLRKLEDSSLGSLPSEKKPWPRALMKQKPMFVSFASVTLVVFLWQDLDWRFYVYLEFCSVEYIRLLRATKGYTGAP